MTQHKLLEVLVIIKKSSYTGSLSR